MVEEVIRAEDIELVVDYRTTWQEMMRFASFDWCNPDILEKNFPLPESMLGKSVSLSGKIFGFSSEVSSANVIEECRKQNCRPANLAELFVLAQIQPGLKKRFPVVALGSVYAGPIRFCDYGYYVPVMNVDGRQPGRRLNLMSYDCEWETYFRFLVIDNPRKI